VQHRELGPQGRGANRLLNKMFFIANNADFAEKAAKSTDFVEKRRLYHDVSPQCHDVRLQSVDTMLQCFDVNQHCRDVNFLCHK